MKTISIATKTGLEEIALALAEGEHDLGSDATAAGNALTMWTGSDCPWFIPRPSAGGFAVENFRIVEEF